MEPRASVAETWPVAKTGGPEAAEEGCLAVQRFYFHSGARVCLGTNARQVASQKSVNSASNVYHAPGWLQKPGFTYVVSGLFLLDDGFNKDCEFVIGGTPS